MEFYKNIITELNQSFNSKFWHIGGDEPDEECLREIEWIRKMVDDGAYRFSVLTTSFRDQLVDILHDVDSDISPIYWYQHDKMSYKEEDILEFWGDHKYLNTELALFPKNKFILSPTYYQASCGYPHPFGLTSLPCGQKSYKMYATINPDDYNQRGQILGGEVTMWSEMNNEYDFLTKINPYAGSMAFRYWNPEYAPSGGSQAEYIMRLQYRLKSYGIPTSKASMRYCEEHTHHCFGP